MAIEKQMTVGQVAREIPAAIRFFEKAGLDYCCGGGKSLEVACREAGLNLETVLASLETIQEISRMNSSGTNWNTSPLSELTKYIVEKHHATVRTEIPRLVQLIEKMCAAHGEKRKEFPEVNRLIGDLMTELHGHLRKEEEILFPYIQQLESAMEHSSTVPQSCFPTVRNPIAVMEQEHENAGELLRAIQSQLVDRSGCPTCLEFFRTLDDFEQDLHRHIHLENNILFPRAIELEAKAQRV